MDKEAKWVKKKGHFYLGYKMHTRVDSEGYVDELAITAANVHDSQILFPVLQQVSQDVRILAEKSYSSKANKKLLKIKVLKTASCLKLIAINH